MLTGLFSPFSFLRPEWLLGLALLPFAGWVWTRWPGQSDWARYLDAEKLAYLKISESRSTRLQGFLTIAFLAIALLALAGPSFRSLPVPVQKARDAVVVAFDLSPSMLAHDLEPDRLTRARLKIIDFLRRRHEGETALVAYAGDAYRVSPLTDDAKTIEALMPSLHPSIMPAPGSNVEAALEMARELFAGASIEKGSVLLVTDGIDPTAFSALDRALDAKIQLCILAVGGSEGVPIPLPRGGFLRDEQNKTILARVNVEEIAALAARHGSCFARLTSDDSDLDRVENALALLAGESLDDTDATFVKKVDEGHWLVLLLLPLAAIAFRKNTFWIVVLASAWLTATPDSASALGWQDLWARPDQQRYRSLNQGIEQYRQKDYDAAAETFDGPSTIEAYNRANALALAGKLEDALESYDRVLETDPNHENARFNRERVERLLEQQKAAQEPQSGEDGEQSEDGESKESEESNPSDESESSQSGAPNEDSESGDHDSQSDASPSGSQDDPRSGSSSDSPPESENAGSEADAKDGEEGEQGDEEGVTSDPAAEAGQDQENEQAVADKMAQESEPSPLSERSEQWLRKIPDDPGGLMRRKFEYQAEQRRQNEAMRGRRSPMTRY